MDVLTAPTQSRQRAHELIDRVTPGQLPVVVGLLEIVVDPLAHSLANAPYEDETISEEETQAVANSEAWLENNEPIPNEVVLAEFGLTEEDFERMGRAPFEPNGVDQ
jgi:hypothetical protein